MDSRKNIKSMKNQRNPLELLSVHQGEQGSDRQAYLQSKSPLRPSSQSIAYKRQSSRERMPLYEALLNEEILHGSFYRMMQQPHVKLKSERRSTSRNHSRTQSPMVPMAPKTSQKKQKEPQSLIWQTYFEGKEFTLSYQKQLCKRFQEIVDTVQCRSCHERVHSVIMRPLEVTKNELINELFFKNKSLEKTLSKSISKSLAQITQMIPEINKPQTIKQTYLKSNDEKHMVKKLRSMSSSLSGLLKNISLEQAELGYYEKIAETTLKDPQNRNKPPSVLQCLKLKQKSQINKRKSKVS